LLLKRGGEANTVQAEHCFHHAIGVARQQRAKSLELRAVTSLARFWHGRGQSPQAASLLAETYGWFSEGFDTADLQEAHRLLAVTRGSAAGDTQRRPDDRSSDQSK
jgi:adenylate cyclase